jgi:3-oxoacyl-[acyl-carrier protein] reductase
MSGQGKPLALDGQVVLVTGGSRGIGAAVARQVAATGARVTIGYRTQAASARAVVDEIERAGGHAVAMPLDVTSRSDVDAVVQATIERFGRIDGLVNNAGVMPTTSFLDIDADTWDIVLRTDLTGAFHTCQAVIPHMLRLDTGGRIVNIGSRLSHVGWPGAAHYCAAKAGLVGLTKSLAREFGQRGIRVNAVAPGLTRTEMASHALNGPAAEQRRAAIPLGRFGEADEVAAAVVFLLSDASVLFLGQTLHPNAGEYMP